MADEPIASRLFRLIFRPDKGVQDLVIPSQSSGSPDQVVQETLRVEPVEEIQGRWSYERVIKEREEKVQAEQDALARRLEDFEKLKAEHQGNIRSQAIEMERLLYYDDIVHEFFDRGDWRELLTPTKEGEANAHDLKMVLEKLLELKTQVAEREHELAVKTASYVTVEAANRVRDARLKEADQREVVLNKKIADLEQSGVSLAVELGKTKISVQEKVASLQSRVAELQRQLKLYPGDPGAIVQMLKSKEEKIEEQYQSINGLRSKVVDLLDQRRERNEEGMARLLDPSPTGSRNPRVMAQQITDLRAQVQDLSEQRSDLKKQIRDLTTEPKRIINSTLPSNQELLARAHQQNEETSRRMMSLREEQKGEKALWEQERNKLAARITKLTKDLETSVADLQKGQSSSIYSDLDLTLISEIPGIGFPEELQFPLTICTMGSGPWDENQFDAFLKKNDFDLRSLPYTGVGVVILGREGWTQSAILNQIDDREGESLRIYSQEMFLMALLRGADPLEDWPDEVLENWGRSHPALRFLMNRETAWPRVTDHDEPFDPEIDLNFQLVDRSPLSEMGYHVGLSSALSSPERRAILKNALEGPLPSVADEAYMETWGKPRSSRRLGRMAWHIAWLANTQGKARNKEVARGEWVEDLAWMKKQLFSKYGRGFKWPST